jgi:Galactose oxidase, central domain
VTLSLGNVDFTLSPSSSLSGVVSDGDGMVNFRPDREHKGAGAYIVDLVSFTGTLRVVATEPLATPKNLKTNDKRRLEPDPTLNRPQLDCPVSSKRIRTVADNSKDGRDDDLLPTETSGSFCGVLDKISRYDTDVDTSSSLLASPASSEASLPLAATTTLGQPDWSQTQSIDDSNHTKPLEGPSHNNRTIHELVDSLVGRARISIGNSPHVEPQIATATTDHASDHKENAEPRRPCPRWGHSMTLLDEDTGRVLVYGGQSLDAVTKLPVTLSDVHIHHPNESLPPSDDVATLSWVQPFHCHGFPRQWHTATYLPDRRLLISLGGESVLRDNQMGATPRTNGGGRYPAADQRELEAKASVMVLDTEIMVWYPPTISGDDSPMKHRSGHSATLLRDEQGRDTGIVLVFGGVRNKRHWLNSISLLDCTLWKWYNVPKSAVVGSPPPPRSYHSAVALNGYGLVLFGGNNQNQCWDSVHVLQRFTRPVRDAAVSKTELLLHQEELDDASEEEEGDPALFRWQWSHPSTSGSGPCARTGHTAVLLDNGRTIWIHGGWDPNEDDDHVFGDSFYLDTVTWTWTKGPTVPGMSKRVGHTAVLLPKKNKPDGDGADTSTIAIFGGRIPGSQFSGDLVTLSV